MFISVKEAVELTGKSQTTIYRLCTKRSHTKYVTKKDNKYYIDKEYLLDTYSAKQASNKKGDNIYAMKDKSLDIPFEVKNKMDPLDTDQLINKISEKYHQSKHDIEIKTLKNSTNNINYKESIIGIGISLIIIASFILMLYFSTKH